ncbi:PPW family C-terminal domain-containing PPE protein [Mycobacterium interjectum]|uniref:PPW family C-terminal domain-containing PPE protein n=1 Tax=Mycobacterium interjectum TaxID=33895 RepID=UPI0009FF1E09
MDKGQESLDPDFSVAASDQGAGTLGFAGTAHTAGAEPAAGLTTLAGDSMGRGPVVPMTPTTWNPDAEDARGE